MLISFYKTFLLCKNCKNPRSGRSVISAHQDFMNSFMVDFKEEIHLKAVDGLLLDANPVESLYLKIKDNLEELNLLNNELKELPIELQESYILNMAKEKFRKLAVISFESLEKSLKDMNEKDSTEVLNLITTAFRYARRSLYVKSRNIS